MVLFGNRLYKAIVRLKEKVKVLISGSKSLFLSTKNSQFTTINNPYKVLYERSLISTKTNKGTDYVEITDKEEPAPIANLKLIAFYLPQFHPIPENDLWWGKGFTEWTNVSKAIPQFLGHHHPRLPGELGFYDLRIPEVQIRQVELAKKYGLYGFCFHYYWFNGKRLLESPLFNFLNNPTINFPFCICWANENWTRRWDGQDDDILIAQEHNFENDKRFIADLELILQNPNYIRINGRPLIVIYRTTLLKELHRTEKYWREFCIGHGLGNPMLVAAQTFGFTDPTKIGFDAGVEFPPHNINYSNIKPSVTMLNLQHSGAIYDYREMISKNLSHKISGYKLFKTVAPGWDNEARKPGQGSTFINSSPRRYRHWLEQVCLKTMHNHSIDERIVFINAWNEWAEGAYLEPDRHNGYAYLQATLDALKYSGYVYFQTKEGSKVVSPKKRYKTAVIMHVDNQELFAELADSLRNLNDEFDLYVSLPSFLTSFEDIIYQSFPKANIFLTNNQGRDIAPFIDIYRAISHLRYEIILKLHTKKAVHRLDVDSWRTDIIANLIGSSKTVNNIKEVLLNSKVGIIGAKGHVLDHRIFGGYYKNLILNLAKEVGIAVDSEMEFSFVTGSMFWAKPEAFQFLDLLPINSLDFEQEPIPPAGTLALAIERFFGLAVKAANFLIQEVDSDGNITDPNSDNYAFTKPRSK